MCHAAASEQLSAPRTYVMRAAAVFGRRHELGPAREVIEMAGRKTSAKAAKAASKVLRDGRTGKASKAAAGSALSQAAPKSGGKGKK